MMLEAYRGGRLPLDRLISHRLTLDEVDTAVALVRSGEAVRAVLQLAVNKWCQAPFIHAMVLLQF